MDTTNQIKAKIRSGHTPAPREKNHVGLTTLRMSPDLNSPTKNRTLSRDYGVPPMTKNDEDESDSDDGSDIAAGDTYGPPIDPMEPEKDGFIDEGYDPWKWRRMVTSRI